MQQVEAIRTTFRQGFLEFKEGIRVRDLCKDATLTSGDMPLIVYIEVNNNVNLNEFFERYKELLENKRIHLTLGSEVTSLADRDFSWFICNQKPPIHTLRIESMHIINRKKLLQLSDLPLSSLILTGWNNLSYDDLSVLQNTPLEYLDISGCIYLSIFDYVDLQELLPNTKIDFFRIQKKCYQLKL